MAKTDPIRIVPHTYERIPDYGHFDVIYPGGTKRFEWDENAGRRAISQTANMTREEALQAAKEYARSKTSPSVEPFPSRQDLSCEGNVG